MRHLCDTGENREIRMEMENAINSSTPKLARNGLCDFNDIFISTEAPFSQSGIISRLKSNDELFPPQKIVCLTSSRKVTQSPNA